LNLTGIILRANSPIFAKDLQLLGQVFFPGDPLRVMVPPEEGAPADAPWQVRVTALPLDGGHFPVEPDAVTRLSQGAGETWEVVVEASSPQGDRRATETVTVPATASPRAFEHAVRKSAQGLLVDVLAELTGFHPGWGILTGVRPTKLVHQMLDEGVADPVEKLVKTYRLTRAKAELVTEVARFQRPFLHQDPRAVSLYIGIPFCPTICSFCSFSIYPINEHRGQLPTFFEALAREMEIIGQAIRDLGLRVESIYFGGGTPTSPRDEDFARMIRKAEETLLKGQSPKEYTVEGGRPETFTRHKLDTMAAAGVNRVSVNPQTTVQATLMHLGRIHTTEKFYRAYELVRSHPHNFIVNCDTIIGLPGEGRLEVEHTLQDMERLQPDNLTVHTLAIKRGSRLHQTGAATEALTRLTPEEAEELVSVAAQTARRMGQHPYYLYRQKYMVGSMENVGYSLPGKESIYNIQMMEERQTVIGLGAGATSKWYKPLGGHRGWLMQAKDNPNEPSAYIERAEVNAWERVRQLRLIYEPEPVTVG
jgi:oxygen-independent coproporphyrinogen-3 oxidase